MDYLIQNYGFDFDTNDARVVFIRLDDDSKYKLQFASKLIEESGDQEENRKLESIVLELEAYVDSAQGMIGEIGNIYYHGEGYNNYFDGGQCVEHDLQKLKQRKLCFLSNMNVIIF